MRGGKADGYYELRQSAMLLFEPLKRCSYFSVIFILKIAHNQHNYYLFATPYVGLLLAQVWRRAHI